MATKKNAFNKPPPTHPPTHRLLLSSLSPLSIPLSTHPPPPSSSLLSRNARGVAISRKRWLRRQIRRCVGGRADPACLPPAVADASRGGGRIRWLSVGERIRAASRRWWQCFREAAMLGRRESGAASAAQRSFGRRGEGNGGSGGIVGGEADRRSSRGGDAFGRAAWGGGGSAAVLVGERSARLHRRRGALSVFTRWVGMDPTVFAFISRRWR